MQCFKPGCIELIRSQDNNGNPIDKKGALSVPYNRRNSKCPKCLALIRFVINSPMWAFGLAHHKRIVEKYRTKRQRIPCKFFQESLPRWEQNGCDECFLFCPLGNLCLSGHWLPGSDWRTPFLFSKARKDKMVRAREEWRERSWGCIWWIWNLTNEGWRRNESISDSSSFTCM